ncbi:MAG: single-stranded DNA-binding protein [Proteobacteria bacterium]|nr:MAG: single-stranded DNA-binding protein [Pseudomonadota bacterium]PIE17534.1 MAG: single-stranded DNA-binding protein [Pseudomonadota bacterium]
MARDDSPLIAAATTLNRALKRLSFREPTTHVYNPLDYALGNYRRYVARYGQGDKRALFIGMNPGPFGMAQTGVPFGDVPSVRDFLGITGSVRRPENEHEKRLVLGMDCPRVEVSGRRLWSAIEEAFGSAETFFSRYFIDNYCPLVFMEGERGRNRTPDKLPKAERLPLFAACDEHLRAVVEALKPQFVIGIGAFAEARIKEALEGHDDLTIGRVLHPSPASPRANQGWTKVVKEELSTLGVCDC